MKIYHLGLALAAGYMLLAGWAAEADIGAVGPSGSRTALPTKAIPNNTAATQDKDADDDTDADNADEKQETPLLVIRFNQKHVYFDRVLREAVESTEKTKAGATYDIVSIVPSGGDGAQQNERASTSAAANLDAVVQGLQGLGVQSSRIETSVESSADATAQEIQLFVK